MALFLHKHDGFLMLVSMAMVYVALAGDPDILTDFVAPGNGMVNGSFFTNTALRSIFNAKPPAAFMVSKASQVEFPALNGQSVSYALLQFPAGTVNPPHTHPRGSELLFVLEGSLNVGLIDTTNKLFTQTIKTGDMFVFPKGLAHFQYNSCKEPAKAISAFGSANAGTVSFPGTIFATGIDSVVLAKSFKTDVSTIQKLKAGLAPKS